jgi:hypothetical protein
VGLLLRGVVGGSQASREGDARERDLDGGRHLWILECDVERMGLVRQVANAVPGTLHHARVAGNRVHPRGGSRG